MPSKAEFVEALLGNASITKDVLQAIIREKEALDASTRDASTTGKKETKTEEKEKRARIVGLKSGGGAVARKLRDAFNKDQLFTTLWMVSGGPLPLSWNKTVLAHTLVKTYGMDLAKVRKWVDKHMKQKPYGAGVAQRERASRKKRE